MIKKLIIVFIGAGLTACSSVSVHYVEHNTYVVDTSYSDANNIELMIVPFRAELEKEMSTVIAHSSDDMLTKERPNGRLNNWSADALLNFAKSKFGEDLPIMSLLNVGGLRSPISKGDVTVGDVFKLMPFDNEVVLVKMPASSVQKIYEYIKRSGGEPIGGALISNGQLTIDGHNVDEPFYVVTSDYLMNGGDKMDFFQEKIEVKYANTILRDVFMDACRKQVELKISNDERIQF